MVGSCSCPCPLLHCCVLGVILLCFCTLIVPTTSESKPIPTPTPTPNKLVHDVCIKAAAAAKPNHTRADYNFCINSLYSDSRTPTADRFVLAYVSFDLAYLNATNTNHSISLLLLNSSTTSLLTLKLKKCQSYYVKAIRALASAINDLNSDTFFELGHQAVRADHAARDCEEATFEGQGNSPPLSVMNFNLRGLSNICLVVSTLFTSFASASVSPP